MTENNGGCCSKGTAVDLGLLLIRIGIGLAFIVHGWPKITGGVERWEALGGTMAIFGITFAPAFWGFMAAFAETAGGLFLALGLFVRPFVFLLFFTMFVATVMLINSGAEFGRYAHALEMGIVFFGLLFTGGGRFALGRLIPGLRGKCYC